MEFALSNDGKRIKPTKQEKGFCNICGKQLRPHFHRSYEPHWAHISKEECDPWWENETPWHKNWKSLVDEEFREIPIEKYGEKHRADIRLFSGTVIELQNTPISYEVRHNREIFYENMLWIIHLPKAKIEIIQSCFVKGLFDDIFVKIENIPSWIFQEPHSSPIMLDLDNPDWVFYITEFTVANNTNARTINAFGNFFSKKDFIKDILKSYLFNLDLSPYIPFHRHREYKKRQKPLIAAREDLKSLKTRLGTAIKQKKFYEQIRERQKENEKYENRRQELIADITRIESEFVWGVITEEYQKLPELKEELKKYPKKEVWED